MDPQGELAREMLAAVRARPELVGPAQAASPTTASESLAFVQALNRYGFDFFEEVS